MKEVRCKSCWQEIPARVSVCPRCGKGDSIRVRRAVIELLLYSCAAMVTAALAFWSSLR